MGGGRGTESGTRVAGVYAMTTPTGNIKIISASDGDWEALYLDGKKVLEGHSLDPRQALEAVG